MIAEPSMPLNLKPTEITNKTLSITWSAPVNPNGANTYYMIYRNNEAPNKSLASKVNKLSHFVKPRKTVSSSFKNL